jgi:hypothetical protein
LVHPIALDRRLVLQLESELGEERHRVREVLDDYAHVVHPLDCHVLIENHIAAVAIHFMHYNFARPHKTLANPYPRTPAMAAVAADHVWTLREIAALLD